MELLILLLFVWLIAPIVLGIALFILRRRRRAEAGAQAEAEPVIQQAPPEAPARAGEGLGQLSQRDVTSLLLLRLEFEREHQAGELDTKRRGELMDTLDEVWVRQLAGDGLLPDTGKWRSRRDEGWNVFVRQQAEPPGIPPWREAAPAPEAAPPVTTVQPSQPTPEPAPPRAVTSAPVPAPIAARQAPALETRRVEPPPVVPVSQPAAVPLSPRPPEPGPRSDPAPEPTEWQPRPAAIPASAKVVDRAHDTSAFAFEPSEPSALGKAIQTVSGWPRLAAPFLVQNVGWFIGGFCFLAGTLFLVSVTTGYANAMVILASLAVYSGFLLWAGYVIRRKSPELRTSSNVLLTIGMLLAPMNLTAGAHLLAAGMGSTPALALAVLLAAAQCAGLFVAARFVNALMDRALPSRLAQLFTALCAIQLAAPLVAGASGWPALLAAHGATLVLVGWGLVAFAGDWVRSVFLDRRLIAYYAAGLLVFAALVSFVQIARAYPESLPGGYFGPYLMALVAALFHVDAALKEWTKKHPFLSRFTFGLYALSVVAVVACFDAPGPRAVTLALAAGTYAHVLWRYSSVPALYLFLVAIGWLYGSLALTAFAPAHHLLASLPALAALFALLRWAERRSVALATVCLRALNLAVVGLTVWSLYHGEPGAAAFATGAAATIGVFYALGSAPWLLRASIRGGKAGAINPAPWYYVVATLAAVTLAYAPGLPGVTWSDQLAFSLLGLAAVAAWVGLRLRSGASRARTEASLNSAIVLLAASVVLGATAAAARFPLTPALAGQLTLAGCLAFWLSIELRSRWMFYCALAAFGVTAFVLKRTLAPAPSFGTGAMIGALSLWLMVWWLDRRHERAEALSMEDPPEVTTTTVRVLGWIPVAHTRSLTDGAANR